jgi:hypothetical protein
MVVVSVLVMVLVGVAVFALGIATAWFLVVRGSKATVLTEDDFDDAYQELVAKGELVDRGRDRDAAWRDFNAWQLENDRERLAWEEAPDE